MKKKQIYYKPEFMLKFISTSSIFMGSGNFQTGELTEDNTDSGLSWTWTE